MVTADEQSLAESHHPLREKRDGVTWLSVGDPIYREFSPPIDGNAEPESQLRPDSFGEPLTDIARRRGDHEMASWWR